MVHTYTHVFRMLPYHPSHTHTYTQLLYYDRKSVLRVCVCVRQRCAMYTCIQHTPTTKMHETINSVLAVEFHCADGNDVQAVELIVTRNHNRISRIQKTKTNQKTKQKCCRCCLCIPTDRLRFCGRISLC